MPPPAPTTAYVALGSNLGDRAAALRDAVARLSAAPGVTVTRVSSFLENPAVGGPAGSPPFLNAVAEVRTALAPAALLGRLLEVERAMGRERRERWGPRTIDLDLVLFGDAVIDLPDLTVPHPRMHERAFVLEPLAEVAPDAVHPGLRKTVRQLADENARRDTGFQPVRTDSDAEEPRLTDDSQLPASPARAGSPCHVEPVRAAGGAPALALRPATNADGPAVRDLVFGVLREYGLQPDPCGTDLDLFDVEGNYPMAGGRFDVLVNDAGHVLGTVGLRRVDAGTCELRKMYLHRSARGRGQGRRLLDHALAEARRLGFNRVTLETASVLTEAVALYERYGFKPFTPDPAHKAARCDAAYELLL